MRIQTILTTNFDRLIEAAFTANDMALRVLPVSSKGSLPEPQTVASSNCIVKLHGEVQDTRADLTLDDEPSENDKENFVAYLTRGSGHLSRIRSNSESKRLLVVGYSGADHRCVQMIKNWLESGVEKPIVYWICFSQWDVEKVNALFSSSIYENRVRVTQSSRPDLILHELYQRLQLCLPPGGLTYEFSHVVPPRRQDAFDYKPSLVDSVLGNCRNHEDPIESARVLLSQSSSKNSARRLARDAGVLELKQMIVDAIEGKLNFFNENDYYTPISRSEMTKAELWTPKYRQNIGANDRTTQLNSGKRKEYDELLSGVNRPPIMIETAGGIVRGAALATDEITAKTFKRIFWMETQDYMDADGLLRDLLRSLAVRCGSFQSRHVTLHPLRESLITLPSSYESREIDGWEQRAKDISNHIIRVLAEYRLDATEIVVMLYGRDSYGTCSGIIPAPWFDPKQDEPENLKLRGFHCLIDALGRAGLTVIYFPLTRLRAARKHHFATDDGKGAPATWNWNITTSVGREDAAWDARRKEIDKWDRWAFDPFVPWNKTQTERDNKTQSGSLFRDMIQATLGRYFKFQNDDVTQEIQRDVKDRELIFLYAVTLFRHSRHINALCSEAVFHCPYRFNAYAVDNDFLRSEQVIRWISQLRDEHLFFNKPGGSLWMHRDTRLAIQHFLEQLDLSRFSGETREEKGNSRAPQGNRNLTSLRARLHFWIGDWYQKAFASSGHLTPIVESLHHRVMAATYSQFASYKGNQNHVDERLWDDEEKRSLVRYRVLLFESSLADAHKLVYMAWRALKLWQASSIKVSWLDEAHRQEIQVQLQESQLSILGLLENIEDAEEECAQLRCRLKRAAKRFDDGLYALASELRLEGGGTESRSTSPLATPVNSSLLPQVEKIESSGIQPKWDLVLDHGWSEINDPISASQKFEGKIKEAFGCLNNQADKDALDILQATIDIAHAAVQTSSDQSNQVNPAVNKLSVCKAKWKANFAQDPMALHHMVWLLGEYSYLMLRRAKLLYHANGRIQTEYWIRATIACNLGVDFCKHLPPWLHAFDLHSKVKLHTLYAVNLANIGRFFEASRHLNEAQALLSKLPSRSGADLAAIRLRRAEVLLTECVWTRPFLNPEAINPKAETSSSRQFQIVTYDKFAELLGGRNLILIDGDQAGGDWSELVVENAIQYFKEKYPNEPIRFVPARIAECLRKDRKYRTSPEDVTAAKGDKDAIIRHYSSLIDEAVALLEQAEECLSGASQSCLWWSRLHTLRLRAYGLLEPLGKRAAESILLRKQSSDQGIYESFQAALRIAQANPIRIFRTIRYFFHANKWHIDFESSSGPGDSTEPHTRLPDSYSLARSALEQLAIQVDVESNYKYQLAEAQGTPKKKKLEDFLAPDNSKSRRSNKENNTPPLHVAIVNLKREFAEFEQQFQRKK
ncbi:SIR2 family protein [Blastopirellula sp. J2-11]|uniref:SIR2 family protein n=1 Tax=Blastopirellula sp. J2-11 TaxID=2943192 RepID=UPI0021C80D36|nr:SIR2 family protein [Blastopirellula sp. J2-11]UUO06509.1 SIR2 family protein [Blastopirellula sp. J2-11]